MDVKTNSDLDFLTALMKLKQQRELARRMLDDAKAAFKAITSEMDQLLDQLEPHVMRRRDDINLPKLDFLRFDDPRPDKDDDK